MNLVGLVSSIEQWYGAGSNDFGVGDALVQHIENPVLRSFYCRLGALASRAPKGAHPSLRALATQDRVLSPSEATPSEPGFTPFLVENQGVWVAAASDQSENAFAKGDAIFDERLTHFTDIEIPLEEVLVTAVLQETILSIQDRYPLISPGTLDAAFAIASAGHHERHRYVWFETYFEFWLSPEVWFMAAHNLRFAAHRGLWMKPPVAQRILGEDGSILFASSPRE